MTSFELILCGAAVAIVSSGLSLWAFNSILRSYKEALLHLRNRLNYLETGMAFHELIPMPWELDDLDQHYDRINTFKQEGNVVYLQNDE